MSKVIFVFFRQIRIFVAVIILIQFFYCCTTYKASYFMDLPNSADTVVNIFPAATEPKIKYGDILSLTIIPLDQIGSIYQSPAGGGGSVSFSPQNLQLNAPPSNNEYIVDKNGIIEAPLIGKIKLIDLTIDQAKEVLRKQYALFYKSFTVNLYFTNHKITVLGEVGRPGSYNIPTDQISIFDALGLAGDITIFGKKDNVLLLRDSSYNKKHLVRLDLNSKSILSSPYYYLKENDVIYVEPTKNKLVSTDAYRNRNLAIYTATLSFIVILLIRTHVIK
jgi:polysaccharide export outer membrane protein